MGQKLVVITFDDGQAGNYDYALPIIEKYNFTATFFVTSGWVGKRNMLTWEQLRHMADRGMEIQSHTVSHAPLSTLSPARLERELVDSKKALEDMLGRPVDFLSLPHGDYDSRVEQAARDAGYRAAFTSRPKYFRENQESFFIGRIDIRSNYDMTYYASIVEKRARDLKRKELMHGAKRRFRSLLGPNTYRKVYRFMNRIELEDYQ